MKNHNNSDHKDNNDKWHLSLRVYSTTGKNYSWKKEWNVSKMPVLAKFAI